MSHANARIDDAGRLLVPPEALEAAGLAGCSEFAFDVDPANGSVTLTAVVDDEDDDSWANTPEFLDQLDRGLEDSREGRFRRLTVTQLRELMTGGNA